jgi:hypothetical protein
MFDDDDSNAFVDDDAYDCTIEFVLEFRDDEPVDACKSLVDVGDEFALLGMICGVV